MSSRKLDVSTGAGGEVSVRRTRFDRHLNECATCTTKGLCGKAETMWRDVILTAIGNTNTKGGR